MSSRRKCLSQLFGHLVLVLFLLCAGKAFSEELPEYQLKAAFLYNFAKFTTWSSTAFPQPDSPLVIGILGDDPFGNHLTETTAEKNVNGHPFEIRRLKRGDALTQCHILFVSRSEQDFVPEILDSVRGKSVLTVGETERFAHQGGVINFVLVSKAVRFEINAEAAEAARLKISSKLGSLGIMVKTEKPRK